MAINKHKFLSVINCKCPKCRKGYLFEDTNPYKLSQMSKMHKSCPVCNEDFMREPGFYFGASYVSYAITVAIWVAVLVALYTFNAVGLIEFAFLTHPKTLLFSGVTTLIILLPIVYRVSRSIWLSFFTDYEE